MSMKLSYSKEYSDLVFPLDYMNLPIIFEFIEDKKDIFFLQTESGDFSGIKEVFNFIISLCKENDPHDLNLINENVVKEIFLIKDSNPKKIVEKMVKKEQKIEEDTPNVGISINKTYGCKQPTLTDVFLFSKMFQILRNGAKLGEGDAKKWFFNFQDEIEKNLKIEAIKAIDFHYFDIRAGRIDSVDDIPGKDDLYVEAVQADKKRQICSGLRKNFTKGELVGKHFLFMINLKPKKYKTEGGAYVSEGMILCAVDEKSDILEPIEVPNHTGKQVTIESPGYQISPRFEYSLLDLGSKKTFKNQIDSLKEFHIKNYTLYFENRKCLLNGEEIKTKKIENGTVS